MLKPANLSVNIHENDRPCMYLRIRVLNFLKVDTKNERKTCFKGAFGGTKFGLDKHRESSAAPTVDPTVVRVHLR